MQRKENLVPLHIGERPLRLPPSNAALMAEMDSELRLERLLDQQRVLAWLFSIVTLLLTVSFFALMQLDAPFLSHVAFGRSITVANIVAVGLIAVFLLSIAFFGRRASRIDQQLLDCSRRR
jgi:uncharacterized membrane protein (DUF485 family)